VDVRQISCFLVYIALQPGCFAPRPAECSDVYRYELKATDAAGAPLGPAKFRVSRDWRTAELFGDGPDGLWRMSITFDETPSDWPSRLVTDDEFADAYQARLCWELEACSGEACVDPPTSDVDFTGCTFDAEAATVCVEGEWTCAEVVEGLFLPVPAAECEGVYTCPE
jgi:hypothetical protein